MPIDARINFYNKIKAKIDSLQCESDTCAGCLFYTEGNKYEACDIPDFVDYLNGIQVNSDEL